MEVVSTTWNESERVESPFDPTFLEGAGGYPEDLPYGIRTPSTYGDGDIDIPANDDDIIWGFFGTNLQWNDFDGMLPHNDHSAVAGKVSENDTDMMREQGPREVPWVSNWLCVGSCGAATANNLQRSLARLSGTDHYRWLLTTHALLNSMGYYGVPKLRVFWERYLEIGHCVVTAKIEHLIFGCGFQLYVSVNDYCISFLPDGKYRAISGEPMSSQPLFVIDEKCEMYLYVRRG